MSIKKKIIISISFFFILYGFYKINLAIQANKLLKTLDVIENTFLKNKAFADAKSLVLENYKNSLMNSNYLKYREIYFDIYKSEMIYNLESKNFIQLFNLAMDYKNNFLVRNNEIEIAFENYLFGVANYYNNHIELSLTNFSNAKKILQKNIDFNNTHILSLEHINNFLKKCNEKIVPKK